MIVDLRLEMILYKENKQGIILKHHTQNSINMLVDSLNQN